MTTQSLDRTAYLVREAHETLGVSPATFWKYVKLGQIKTIPFGGRTLVPADEIRRIAAEGLGAKSRRGAYRPRKTEGAEAASK